MLFFKGVGEEPSSVVDSESDSESSSSQIDQNEGQVNADNTNKRRKLASDSKVESFVVPETE